MWGALLYAGTVQLAAPPLNTSAGVPFLFDIASMPSRNASCAHCPAREPAAMPPCCGVCVFAKRKCVDFYPGKNVSERVAKHLVDSGNDLEVSQPLCHAYHGPVPAELPLHSST
jgi:hypothetical protein